jgi:hypothetical protein
LILAVYYFFGQLLHAIPQKQYKTLAPILIGACVEKGGVQWERNVYAGNG